jgi:hypothetical protein
MTFTKSISTLISGALIATSISTTPVQANNEARDIQIIAGMLLGALLLHEVVKDAPDKPQVHHKRQPVYKHQPLHKHRDKHGHHYKHSHDYNNHANHDHRKTKVKNKKKNAKLVLPLPDKCKRYRKINGEKKMGYVRKCLTNRGYYITNNRVVRNDKWEGRTRRPRLF